MKVIDILCAVYGILVCDSPDSSVNGYIEVKVKAKFHMCSTPYSI